MGRSQVFLGGGDVAVSLDLDFFWEGEKIFRVLVACSRHGLTASVAHQSRILVECFIKNCIIV